MTGTSRPCLNEMPCASMTASTRRSLNHLNMLHTYLHHYTTLPFAHAHHDTRYIKTHKCTCTRCTNVGTHARAHKQHMSVCMKDRQKQQQKEEKRAMHVLLKERDACRTAWRREIRYIAWRREIRRQHTRHKTGQSIRQEATGSHRMPKDTRPAHHPQSQDHSSQHTSPTRASTVTKPPVTRPKQS